MAATIRDITKATGLSLATVSKYLNGGNVLPENKELIEKAIAELHYEVNELARGLATNKTKTIGVLVHNIDNIFAGTIITHIEDTLRQHNYGTIICDCRGDERLEEEEVHFLLNKRVDGIITIPTANKPGYLEAARKRGIPVVLMDRTFEDKTYDSVVVDNEKAAYEAAGILISRGHRKLAIICGDEKEYTAVERRKGFERAVKEAYGSGAVEKEFIKQGRLTVEHGYQSMREIMEGGQKPTAVFLSNYEITLGAIIAINEMGIQFPEEISLIGFDNMMLTQIVKPKLWMVVQPMQEIATQASELMLRRLMQKKDDLEPIAMKLHTSILEGSSIKEMPQKI